MLRQRRVRRQRYYVSPDAAQASGIPAKKCQPVLTISYLLNLHVRHKNAASLDVDCPFCGEKKGKLNLNTKKNVFKCNRCGESGGMLSLYGKIYGGG